MPSSLPWRAYLRTSIRRFARARHLRFVLVSLLVVAIVDFLSLSWTFSRQSIEPNPREPKSIPKIYVASTHWNNGAKLRGFWNQAILNLAEHVGVENIYVSIYESGSWDDSKDALIALDHDLQRLGVQRTIHLDNTTHADDVAATPTAEGWIDTPRGRRELRRIPYLAKLRNKSLQPMLDLAINGIRFDKVLFLNDVAFTTRDVMALLETRNGQYAAACSMDFQDPPRYYDTFALRDSGGHEAAISTFPYFRSRASRSAMISGRPTPVQSCWNGIVAFNAFPFYKTIDRLRFRGIPDSLARHHLEASECCLIHADNSFTSSHGVWINPDVRVGYSLEAYNAVHQGPTWPSATARFSGIWINRISRWSTFTFHKSWVVKKRLGAWAKTELDHHEPGIHCLINEMQVLIPNGWAHV